MEELMPTKTLPSNLPLGSRLSLNFISSNLNAHFIHDGLPQGERLLKLNQIAIHQMKLLTEDHQIKKLNEKETAGGRE
jgi:hypothetical protein